MLGSGCRPAYQGDGQEDNVIGHELGAPVAKVEDSARTLRSAVPRGNARLTLSRLSGGLSRVGDIDESTADDQH
jgi:hypothetical protein